MGSSTLDEKIDALYGLPFGEFVSARKRLATDLRRSGDAAGARTVRSLRKSTVAAWVTNQAIRKEPVLVQELVAATHDLAAVQRGGARADEQRVQFQDARLEQKRLIERLMTAARTVTLAGAQKPAAQVLEKVERNLSWGPLSKSDLPAFERGRLVADVAAPGFGALLEGNEADGPITTSGAARRSSVGDTAGLARGRAGGVPRGRAPGDARGRVPDEGRPRAERSRVSARSRQDAPRSREDAKIRQERSQHAQEQARVAAERRRDDNKHAVVARANLRRAQTEAARARRELERCEHVRDRQNERVEQATRALDEANDALKVADNACLEARHALADKETAESEAHRGL